MKKTIIIIIPIICLLFACTEKKQQTTNNQTKNQTNNQTINSENLLNAVAWYQQSAEMTATYYQAFNTAKKQIPINIEKSTSKLPKAIIVDIDETMLDNSPFEVYLIQNNLKYTKELWNQWVNLKQAKALPGALDFTIYAQKNNVEIIYISNRNIKNTNITIENLKNEKFPFADNKHVLLKDTTSDKTNRRNIITKKYDIIMYIGDNLRDFDEIFKQKNQNNRKNIVKEKNNLFGTKYIILPNPMYGEWTKKYNSTEKSYPKMIENMKTKLSGY